MHQVIYFSRGGNTRKVAEIIADEIGVNAQDVEEANIEKGKNFFFLGSGCYGGKPSPKILNFIQAHDFTGQKIALFGTSGSGQGKELESMEKALLENDAKIVGKYSCKGKTFVFINRKHPNKEDLDLARRFARNLIKEK